MLNAKKMEDYRFGFETQEKDNETQRSGVLEGNTSQAHEYGHSLGLMFHDNGKIIGQPGIMTTIHSLVEGKYTEDGQASTDEDDDGIADNHLLDRNNRKVTQSDVSRIRINNWGNDSRRNRVGASSNKLFNESGEVVDKTSVKVKVNNN